MLEIYRTVKPQLLECRDCNLCDSDTCLVKSLAPNFFNGSGSLACEFFLRLMRGLYLFGQSDCSDFNVLPFSVIIEVKKFFCSGA